MPNQPDLRKLLTDALIARAATFDECSETYLSAWSERTADVLLSLPGIAIVETEVDHQLGDRWKTFCSKSPDKARVFAAALLAAAAAAEADHA